MIDFGLSEIMLIGVVTLIVVGPEKLPKVARLAGSVFGRAQRYVHQLRAEVNREFAIDDLHQLREEMHGTIHEIENSLSRNSDFFGNTSPAASSDNPVDELAAAKARAFRRRKTDIRTAAGTRSGGKRLERKHLASDAARASRESTRNPASPSFR